MTISTAVVSKTLVCDGVSTAFALTGLVYFATTDLAVQKIVDGVASDLTLGTHYTLTGAGTSGAGIITTTSVYTSGVQIFVLRNTDDVQQQQYPEGGGFPSADTERAFDRRTMRSQELALALRKTIRVGLHDADQSPVTPVSNRAIVFDVDGQAKTSKYDPDEMSVLAESSVLLAQSAAASATASAVAASSNPSYPEVRVLSHAALVAMTWAQMKAAQCVLRDAFYEGSPLGYARFYWTDTATTPDGYTRISGSDDPNGYHGVLIIEGNPLVTDFGCYCDGTTLDDTALNRAGTAAARYGYNIIFPWNKWIKLSGAHAFDLGLYSVFGNGCILDFSGIADGATAVTLFASSSISPAQIAIATYARTKFTNLVILGPGKAGSGAAYSLTSKGLLLNSANLYPDHLAVCGFGYGVYFGSTGVYMCTLTNCAIQQNKYGIYGPSGGSDYGEKLSLIGGVIGGNLINISWHIPTGRLCLYDVSVDYPGATQIELDNSGEVVMYGGWYECNDAGSGAVTYINSGYLLQFVGTHFQLAGSPGSLSQAALGTTAAGAITLYDQVFMFNTQNTSDVLDNGAGFVKLHLAASYGVRYIPSVICSSANLLCDPGISNSGISDLWYVSGGTSVSRLSNTNIVITQDTSVYYSDSASLKVVKSNPGTSDGFGLITRLKGDGRVVSITGKYRVTAGSNGGVIYCQLVAYKMSGINSYGVPVATASSVLATIGLGGTTSLVDWTSFGMSGMAYASPEWADAVGLYFNSDPFSGTVNFDNMNITII